MKKLAELAPLKVTTGDDGYVYYADGEAPSRSSGLEPREFLESLPGRRTLRILAVPPNVPLICAAWRYTKTPGAQLINVELGRPANVDWEKIAVLGPRETLAQLKGKVQHASCGGWHRMTDREIAVYTMALHASRGGDDAGLVALFNAHPASAALRFIPHLNLAATCRLLVAILDPRWWIKPAAPDRDGRLRCRLGLVEATPTSPGRVARRRLVTSAWKTSPGVPEDTALPGYFLWRYWATVAGDAVCADFRTDRRFIAYLKAVWLDAMVGGTPRCPGRLFVPDHFFNDATTAAAWRTAVPAL